MTEKDQGAGGVTRGAEPTVRLRAGRVLAAESAAVPMQGGHQGLCRVGYSDRKQWQPEEEEPACWEAGREGGRGPKAKPKVIDCFSFEMSTRNLGTGGNTERRGTVMPQDHDEDVELSCAQFVPSFNPLRLSEAPT